MLRIGKAALLIVLTLTSCAQAAWSTTWTLDDFTVDQQELGGSEDQFNTVNGTMLGSNRDQVYVNFEYGDGNWENVSDGAWSGYGEFGSGAFALQYDGPDETKHLDINGLGNVDLTANGGMAFRLVIWSEWGGEVSVLVYTNNGTQTCSWTQNLEFDVTKTYDYYQEFSEMASCDFTQVSAVELAYPYPSISMVTYSFEVVTDGTVQPSTPTPSALPSPFPSVSPTRSSAFAVTPSRSSSYGGTPGGSQVLDIGYPVTVSVSASSSASFETQQIDPTSVSSIGFVCQTPSSEVCMYTQFGSPPSQFSFDLAGCSSNENPIELTYSSVKSGVYYALVIAGESTTATVMLAGQR